MEHLSIRKKNDVYLQVDSSSGVFQELSEFFKFRVPGYQFMAAYKMRTWDGNIRLFNTMDGSLYTGLLHYLKVFCDARRYTFDVDPKLEEIQPWLREDTEKFIRSLKLPFTARDYQVTAINHAVKHRRALLVSPTGSGKSLILYSIARHYKKKTLIIVPTISLVSQMISDFREYSKEDPSFDVDKMCHPIFAGQDKVSKKPIIVSTWQSIYKMPKEFFVDFEVVVGDECLHPSTKIMMADKTKQEIRNIKIGDLIKTYNENTKQTENKKVLKVHQNISINEQMYEILLDTGKTLKITGNHKVLLKNGIWKKVEDLKIDDDINSLE